MLGVIALGLDCYGSRLVWRARGSPSLLGHGDVEKKLDSCVASITVVLGNLELG